MKYVIERTDGFWNNAYVSEPMCVHECISKAIAFDTFDEADAYFERPSMSTYKYRIVNIDDKELFEARLKGE